MTHRFLRRGEKIGRDQLGCGGLSATAPALIKLSHSAVRQFVRQEAVECANAFGRSSGHLFNLLRKNPVRPTSPVPNNVREPGSGTVEVKIFVLPLETVDDPLKKLVPVVSVS